MDNSFRTDTKAVRSIADFMALAAKWISLDQGSVLVVERHLDTVRLHLHHSPALEERSLHRTVNFDYFSKHFRKEFPSLPIVGKNTTMTVRSLNEFFISDSGTDRKIKN